MITSSFVKNCIAAAGAIAGGSVAVEFEDENFTALKFQRLDSVVLVDAGDAPRVKFQIMAAVADFAGKVPEENKLVSIGGVDFRMGRYPPIPPICPM